MIPGIVAGQMRAAVAPSGDPHWDSVQLLMSMDSNFNDESSFAKTPNAINGAVISSAQSAFGGASGFFDGTDDDVRFNSETVYQVDQDFTLEAWVYITDLSKTRTIASKRPSTASREWRLQVLSTGAVQLQAFNSSAGAWKTITSANSLVTTNNWHSVAVTGSGDVWRVFVDGNLSVSDGTAPAGTYGTATQSLRIGADQVVDNFMAGYIDELRFTMGICRYTSSYTPSGPFPRGPA